MAKARCPSCHSRKNDGLVCLRCGHDLTGPAPDLKGVRLANRIKSRLLRRPADRSYRGNMPWRRPLLVAAMSTVVIGSGHIYCKSYAVGALYFGLAVFLTWAFTAWDSWWNLWSLFLLAIMWQYQIFQAYDLAVHFDWSSIFRADEMSS